MRRVRHRRGGRQAPCAPHLCRARRRREGRPPAPQGRQRARPEEVGARSRKATTRPGAPSCGATRPPRPGSSLCEGIETGAAVALAFRPEIEAGEARGRRRDLAPAGVEAFQPYPATKRITVAADRDEQAKPGKAAASRRGEKAARTFGLRHHEALQVDIALPGSRARASTGSTSCSGTASDAVRAGIDGASPFVPTPDELAHDDRDDAGSARHVMRWPHGYRLTASGLFYAKETTRTRSACRGPFTVLGLARDPNGNGWAVAIEWRDRDDSPHRGFVAFADLIGDGYDAFRPLVLRRPLAPARHEAPEAAQGGVQRPGMRRPRPPGPAQRLARRRVRSAACHDRPPGRRAPHL